MKIQGLYQQLRTSLPVPVKEALSSLVPQAVRDRLDPLSDPSYRWPLHGPLEGYMFITHGTQGHPYVRALPWYEPGVCAAVERTVRPSMICADVGVHLGYMTLLLAKCCGPDGQVYAFEAFAENAKAAGENMAINGLTDRVVIENLAVSDGREDTVRLYGIGSTSEISLLPRADSAVAVEVKAVTLDGYFPPDRRLDFVKMDIEGAEAQALAGMTSILRHQRPVLLIELHGEPGLAAVSYLRDSHYSLFDLDDQRVDPRVAPPAATHIMAKPPQDRPEWSLSSP